MNKIWHESKQVADMKCLYMRSNEVTYIMAELLRLFFIHFELCPAFVSAALLCIPASLSSVSESLPWQNLGFDTVKIFLQDLALNLVILNMMFLCGWANKLFIKNKFANAVLRLAQ